MSLLILAPMEGLVDAPLRDLLTAVGGLDRVVTEFVRVSTNLLPERVFLRLCPELQRGSRTRSGVPVRLQLLGSDPALMAACARRAVGLGASGIDLNFGCPAPTVNRSRGGAILLREPQTLETLVRAVRQALPAEVPVTAKMRLGYDDSSLALDNALAIAAGGAEEICVHGRTRRQGYGGSADWGAIGRIRAALDIRVVANGDIRTPADYRRCREESGCEDVMLGRGLVARPDLARQIRALDGAPWTPLDGAEVIALAVDFFQRLRRDTSTRHAPGRLKQWLAYLARVYPEIQTLFRRLRRERDPEVLARMLRSAAALSAGDRKAAAQGPGQGIEGHVQGCREQDEH